MGSISSFRLKCATHTLALGGVLIYPTEAVYGIGCDPFNRSAVERIWALKNRPKNKGFILIAADIEQIKPLVRFISPMMYSAWPGPVTFISPVTEKVPRWLVGEQESLAVRVSAHPICQELCKAYGGPIVSTSANPSGLPPAKTRIKARRYFRKENIVYIPGKIGDLSKPTSIYHALSGKKIR